LRVSKDGRESMCCVHPSRRGQAVAPPDEVGAAPKQNIENNPMQSSRQACLLWRNHHTRNEIGWLRPCLVRSGHGSALIGSGLGQRVWLGAQIGDATCLPSPV